MNFEKHSLKTVKKIDLKWSYCLVTQHIFKYADITRNVKVHEKKAFLGVCMSHARATWAQKLSACIISKCLSFIYGITVETKTNESVIQRSVWIHSFTPSAPSSTMLTMLDANNARNLDGRCLLRTHTRLIWWQCVFYT